MSGVTVFPAGTRRFETYLAPSATSGGARIARLVDGDLSQSMGGGVVVYERLTVAWDLPFDEMIVVLEGAMRIHSGGAVHDCGPGDVAWFPAHTALRYEVPERVVVFYATYPIAPRAAAQA
ncbi:cupin domain-containing protein [Dongia sp.]|uniref:cupin domain-containing protein n=1 Tax=Dongia sp. TaxID=1977262 RepID=UPI003751327C